MKIVSILFAGFILAATAVHANIDCGIIPFNGLDTIYTSVNNPAYRAGDSKHLKSWDIIKRPTGGFLGSIVVTDSKAVNCTASMLIYKVLEKDLFQPNEHSIKGVWFEKMGLYNTKSPVRTLLYEHSWKITEVPFEIPIVLPGNTHSLQRCIVVITDNNGKEIYSSIPAEVFHEKYSRYNSNNNNAWVISDDESAHRRLRELNKSSGNIENLSELPLGGWQRFLDTSTIWIDDKTDISTETLRRIMLSGGWVYGTTNGLAPHLKKLNMQSTTILSGGICTTKKNSNSNSRGNQRYGYGNSRFQFSSGSYMSKSITYPLENNRKHFSQLKTPYLIFTLAVMTIYAVGAIIMLPILFLRLKGSHRVELWWKTPLVISIYTIIIVVAGWFIIYPKSNISDVTEYRLGYGDWPEVFCNVNTFVLNYGTGSTGWNYPAATSLISIKDELSNVALTEGDNLPGSINYKTTVQGTQTQNGFCFIKNMRQPFHADFIDGKIHISSDRDVRNLHISLSDSQWIELGKLAAGESVVIPDEFDDCDINFPGSIKNNIRSAKTTLIKLGEVTIDKKECKNCGKNHKHSKNSLHLYDGAVLLTAVDETDMPAVTEIKETKKYHGRVAWICQVPLDGYNTEEEPKK